MRPRLFQNRLLHIWTPYLVLGLCLAIAPASHAIGKKKKKQVDLSANPLGNVESKQPDKELYDKAMLALKKGRFDVARLDLQTLLNTYTDSEYSMRAKLAIGDTWYKEGGTAAMAQAEQEYKDFITFFPNTPEAAEAQMKVGDIYYEQMEKPDRDAQNVVHAETEYRQMIQQFPDSPLVPRAKQRLREVQEVLADRQFEIGEFYVGRENWSAAIARLQTVADSYPLFSHSDQTLISIGDSYASQAAMAQNLNIPPKAKAELVRAYNDRAVSAWTRVVTHYAMAPHVEDAKDRLIAMGRDVPEPTAAEMAESEAEEGSRINLHMKDRALLLIKHGPTTVESARVGEPTLSDPKATYAPAVSAQTLSNFQLAMKGGTIPPAGPAVNSPDTTAVASGAAPQAGGEAVPAVTMSDVPENTNSSGGNSAGVEIISAPNAAPAPAAPTSAGTDAPASAAPEPAANIIATPPSGSAVGATPAGGTSLVPSTQPNPDAIYGVSQPLRPNTSAALPPIDKPAAAPDQINEVKSGGAAQVTTGTAVGKNGKPKKAPKPAFNSGDESSSKHKKKKGVDKLNPF